METQKILKPVGKVVVISDYREKETISHLEELGATVNKMNLDIGDHICSSRICIERKAHSDFISSIIDGRIFEQTKILKENFEKPIIIVEGHSDRQINENALKGMIASLIANFDVSILNTKNPHDTAKTIYWLAKKEQEENKYPISFKVGKKPKEMKRMQEEIVSSLPNVSTVLSKRLLDHFGSIENIFTASEDELQKVKGVGKSLAQKIKKILGSKYQGCLPE
jgi:Fanconi anemia group M protein